MKKSGRIAPKRKEKGKPPLVWLEGVEEARTAHAHVVELLRRYPNVVTVGVGAPIKGGRRDRRAAIIVGVRKKRDMPKHKTIPPELLGVRIDVQQVSQGELVAGDEVQPGLQCCGIGRREFGYFGVTGQLPDGRLAALTALHVLVDEGHGADVDAGQFRGTVIEASFPTGFSRAGVLSRGAFNAGEDIALVLVDNDEKVSATLAGSTSNLSTPVAVAGGQKVQLLVPDGSFDGQVVELNVGGSFDTPVGAQSFHGLAKFSIEADEIRDGWCGSPICTAEDLAPVGLLSFRSTQEGVFAFAFPLAPYWQAWGLTIPKDVS
jgi:hypothetical protein